MCFPPMPYHDVKHGVFAVSFLECTLEDLLCSAASFYRIHRPLQAFLEAATGRQFVDAGLRYQEVRGSEQGQAKHSADHEPAARSDC